MVGGGEAAIDTGAAAGARLYVRAVERNVHRGVERVEQVLSKTGIPTCTPECLQLLAYFRLKARQGAWVALTSRDAHEERTS